MALGARAGRLVQPFAGYFLYYPSRRQSSPAFSLVVVDALRVAGVGGSKRRGGKFRIFVSWQAREAVQLIVNPRRRPTSQDTPPPRTVAASCCPRRCSITGFHGTRLKPKLSSSMA